MVAAVAGRENFFGSMGGGIIEGQERRQGQASPAMMKLSAAAGREEESTVGSE